MRHVQAKRCTVPLSLARMAFFKTFKTGHQITPSANKQIYGANASDLANYRPVANLNAISKILVCLEINYKRTSAPSNQLNGHFFSATTVRCWYSFAFPGG